MIVGFKGRYETEKGEAAWSLESMAAGGTWFWRFRHWVATGNWAAVQGGIRQGAYSKTGNGVISVKFKRGAAREGGRKTVPLGNIGRAEGNFGASKVNWPRRPSVQKLAGNGPPASTTFPSASTILV